MKRLKRLPLVLFGAVLVTAAAWAITPDLPSDGEYLGPPVWEVADVENTAYFETGEDIARYYVIGFDSAPVVLEISDPLNPRLVTGYTDLYTEDDQGIYFPYAGEGQFLAGAEDSLKTIDVIESL